MQIVKFRPGPGPAGLGILDADSIRPIDPASVGSDVETLTELLAAVAQGARPKPLSHASPIARKDVRLDAPIDDQEVWAAGVTYLRSKVAREDESEGAASFYDQVYTADRPEIFFKATPHRVVGPDAAIRVRADSEWTVPEPELGLVLTADLRLVGYTLGNDVSARDIEGRNPLYLPQAKVYDACCALGPGITLATDIPDIAQTEIHLKIVRDNATLFEAATSVDRIVRPFEDLIQWLGRDNSFPTGAILLTGTGIVPPDDLSLQAGDTVVISAPGLGTLSNPVVKAAQ